MDWKEKNEPTERLVTHGHHTPRKYLPEFKQIDSPYFGVIGIHDRNPRIGKKEYLIGLQSLVNGTKVHVVDWRKAEISRFFYDGYEEGEEYEETINGVEDIDAAIEFFTELGHTLEDRMPIKGEWAGRVTGVRGQRVEIAMMCTPDGQP